MKLHQIHSQNVVHCHKLLFTGGGTENSYEASPIQTNVLYPFTRDKFTLRTINNTAIMQMIRLLNESLTKMTLTYNYPINRPAQQTVDKTLFST